MLEIEKKEEIASLKCLWFK